jgi:hypothetical protein
LRPSPFLRGLRAASAFLNAPPWFFLCVVISVFLLTSCGGATGTTSSSGSTSTTSPAVNNTATVTVGFGPLGQTGGYVNGVFTNVTVCQPSTQNCTTIDNVLVDTGSVGLRLVPSALGSLTLNTISTAGSTLEDCIQYGDTSYSWGPMALAQVQIAGETTSNIGVQIIGSVGAEAPASCLTTPVIPGLPNGGNEDTLESLGANGILGIGNGGSDGPWDCGAYCANPSNISTYDSYYVCPGGACEPVAAPTSDQAENPIAAFTSSDTNGLVITLPSVAATGAATLSGTINFGIGTQSDNALSSSATLYAMDQCDDFPTVTFNGFAYTDTFCSTGTGGFGGFLDTGSTGLYVSDANTLASLGIYDCPSNSSGYGFYCVSTGATTTLSGVALKGNANVGSGTVSLTIENATTLLNTNNAVFNDLGGDSGTDPASDYFDFGAPFFLGRTIFIGITGPSGQTSGSYASSAPFGFVAF